LPGAFRSRARSRGHRDRGAGGGGARRSSPACSGSSSVL
jgi:hypothetical protein